ncbi:MAG TPA: glycosyl hydrolase family 88 [Bacteroides sp.]|nr:glycosyl hydrolase family 88 [Bacteroides sp.]
MIQRIVALLAALFLLACSIGKNGEQPSQKSRWSVQMAESVMARHDSLHTYTASQDVWQYDIGLLGMAIDQLNPLDEKYGKYMQDWMDRFVREDGSIRTYRIRDYNIDNINPAKNLFTLYERTGEEKYKKAISLFVEQMESHPRTKAGGFWHKQKYPWQMWLDGIYVGSPFLARYAAEFNEPQWFDVVTQQVILCYDRTLDSETGLLYHAWDESREQVWCNPATGQSKHFWSRAMGWYMMALVDVLDYLPEEHPDRDAVVAILQRTASALLEVRDPDTGLWYQVLDQGGRSGNYLEGSGSAMFIYAFAKGTRWGYLDADYLKVAEEAFQSLTETLIYKDEDGWLSMINIVGGCGLGGDRNYRNGSYEYYTTEKRVKNDPKGVGPFILAALQLEL